MSINSEINKTLKGTGCLLVRSETKNHYFIVAKPKDNKPPFLINISSKTGGLTDFISISPGFISYIKNKPVGENLTLKEQILNCVTEEKITGIYMDPTVKQIILENGLLRYRLEAALKYELPKEHAIIVDQFKSNKQKIK